MKRFCIILLLVLLSVTGWSQGLSRRESRIFDAHVVNRGETAYSISKRYGITVQELLDDNGNFDLSALGIGQVLKIRKASTGQSPERVDESWERYQESMNEASGDIVYHLVKPGETLYSLSRRYGVTEGRLIESNGIAGGIRAGMMLKIPSEGGPDAVSPDESGARLAGEMANVPFRRMGAAAGSGPINVAMFLPFGGQNDRNFTEFYQGALLALEDLKSSGLTVRMDVYDSARSGAEVSRALDSPSFASADLIIGPVYEEEVAPAVRFAERNGIPIVTPLAAMERTGSPVLYQMSPDAAAKYAKLREVLTPDRNTILVTFTGEDAEFRREIIPLLPQGYTTLPFNPDRTAMVAAVERLLSRERENIFIVLCSPDRYVDIDSFLATVSSVQSNLVARSRSNPRISVIGTSRWQRLTNLDRNLFFKLRVRFVASYHSERSNSLVRDFDTRFISAFGTIPTLYSYRGYDTAKLFVSALAESDLDYTDALNSGRATLLAMPYRFQLAAGGRPNLNDQWGLVEYGDDYTITVR